MDDYALVLNAGSSSLKFCVFQRPAGDSWHLAARGQIEGRGGGRGTGTVAHLDGPPEFDRHFDPTPERTKLLKILIT